MLISLRARRALPWVPALLVLASLPAPVLGQERQLFTPEHVATLQGVGGAALAPDGSAVAYTKVLPRDPRKENGTSRSEVHVMDLATKESRPYITTGSASGLTWTHDSSALMFRAKRGEDEYTSIYRLPIGGGEASRVTGLDDRSVSSFSLARDGRVAIVATEPESAEAKARKKRGFNQEIYEEDWRGAGVWIAEADGSARALDIDGHVSEAHWSPDGRFLAIAVAPTSLVDDSYNLKRIWVVSAEDGSKYCAVDTQGKLGAFAWSHDSQRIALLAGKDKHDGAANRLMIATLPEAVRERPVVPLYVFDEAHEEDELGVQWLADGRLAVLGASSVHSTLRTVTFGETGVQVDDMVSPEGPAIASFGVAADGSTGVVVASTSEHPGELFQVDPSARTLTRLTDSNPWLKDLAMGRQEMIRYPARDGLEIHGLLIHPVERAEGERVPLVVCVHGGPEAHISNGWLTRYSYPGHIAAGRGWAVFYPNYRGSTGRGLRYLKTSQGDPAGKEFDDIVDGVDYLIEQGIVDPDRVGVTGGSYGGYATAWCSTRYSDRFAAGVMFVGISNKISKVGTTDIPDEEFHVHAMKRPWDNWQLFLERSPIYHAGNAKTPLLILHGKDDPRVDPGQSQEMYRHMKLRSAAPVRLVLYPGEGHGNRQAAARYDYNLRMLRWFDLYLAGEGGEMPSPELEYGDSAD